MTLTTERANPLRQWNPGWGGCSTARRPVAAVKQLFLRRSVFVKRSTRENPAYAQLQDRVREINELKARF